MPRNLLPNIALGLLLPVYATQAGPITSERLAMGLPASGEIAGELVELNAGGERFFAIFQPQQLGQGRGGIVLMHDQGSKANSLEVIRPLRLGLADAGWDTLSLQLPEAARDEGRRAWQARRAEILARLQAGLTWLKARGQGTQVIIAKGDSGAIALQYAVDRPPRELQALVLVSAVLGLGEPDQREPDLGQLRMPMLDIFAERDIRPVVDTAAARSRAGEAAPGFRQHRVAGATAGFFGLEDDLTGRIRSWLARVVGGPPVDTP